jgi:hypothetical protein
LEGEILDVERIVGEASFPFETDHAKWNIDDDHCTLMFIFLKLNINTL